MAMGSPGGGVGMGYKDLSVVFIFKNADVLNKFMENGWQFGGEADATAKAGDKGAAASKEAAADTGANLFEIYQLTDTGVALQATVAGTKYWKDKEPNKYPLEERNQTVKLLFPMNRVKLLALLALTTVLGMGAPAARGAALNDNIYNYLQLLRSDVNSVKVEQINSIMKLSAEDATKFWPIYHDYENELGDLGINRAELITEFVQSHKDGTFDNEKAKSVRGAASDADWNVKKVRRSIDSALEEMDEMGKSLSSQSKG
jgi:hypothetical protein